MILRWSALLCVLLISVGCRQESKKVISDDFEELTGKGSPAWEFVQTKEDFAYLELFKGIYNAKKQYLHSPDAQAHIPRVVHFIWLGPRPFPRESVENIRSWMAKHPDWTFNFWTDRTRPLPLPGMVMKRVQDFSFVALQECFAKSGNFGEQSDVLRYEILYQEGGIYVDHDVKCFQSFDSLNCAYDFYCGIDMPYTSTLPSCVFTTNNLIAVKPGHPILSRCIELLKGSWDQLEIDYPGTDRDSVLSRVLHRTFWLFGEAVKEKHNQMGNRDVVFPAYYFDAPKDELAVFARHQYAGSWHQTESAFEKSVKERLMKISKKNNLTLLILTCVSSVNIIGLGLLFLFMRKRVCR